MEAVSSLGQSSLAARAAFSLINMGRWPIQVQIHVNFGAFWYLVAKDLRVNEGLTEACLCSAGESKRFFAQRIEIGDVGPDDLVD